MVQHEINSNNTEEHKNHRENKQNLKPIEGNQD